MAIKKGAFDLYTQERKLPEKRSATNKTSHFFDDIDKESNALETVHERSTKVVSVLANTIEQNKDKLQTSDLNNGSQTVHFMSGEHPEILNSNTDISISNAIVSREDNGSQMVHKRFTENAIELSDSFEKNKNETQSTKIFNGSQTVHRRFTEDINELTDACEKDKDETQPDKRFNGSLTVHERFTSLGESQEKKDSTISFSKIIGIQRAVVIALYKNMKFNKSDTTNELTLEAIASLSGVNQKSLKNTLFRLSSTGVILRADQKNGRSGWVKYQICPQILDEIQKNEFSILKK